MQVYCSECDDSNKIIILEFCMYMLKMNATQALVGLSVCVKARNLKPAPIVRMRKASTKRSAVIERLPM